MDETTNNTISETTAPPPPAEVKVRTMRSDIASMAQSGGGLPQFQSVKVEGLTGKEATPTVPGKKNMLMIVLIVVVGVIALTVVAYFAYTLFK
jgi:hypothetical protein